MPLSLQAFSFSFWVSLWSTIHYANSHCDALMWLQGWAQMCVVCVGFLFFSSVFRNIQILQQITSNKGMEANSCQKRPLEIHLRRILKPSWKMPSVLKFWHVVFHLVSFEYLVFCTKTFSLSVKVMLYFLSKMTFSKTIRITQVCQGWLRGAAPQHTVISKHPRRSFTNKLIQCHSPWLLEGHDKQHASYLHLLIFS